MSDRELTFTVDMNDGDLVCAAVVVLSVLPPDDSTPHVEIHPTEGLSLIEQAGMLRIAERVAVVEACECE